MKDVPPFVVVIPARHASTRLPGKPLADIAGKPMVVHVADRARRSGARSVCVATDHEDIAAACRKHGHEAVMTRADHPSGTDRIAEVARQLRLARGTIVVNVQGDEPLMEPALIRAVASLLHEDRSAAVATACCPIGKAAELFNPNAVKVVLDARGQALYFSRAPIPWDRDRFAKSAGARTSMAGAVANWYRHIGIYAYRVSFLERYGALAPSPLEQAEALEQLRVLWHGFQIAVAVRSKAPPAGVDTPADLRRVRAALKKPAAATRKAVSPEKSVRAPRSLR